jgi:cytochrome c553
MAINRTILVLLLLAAGTAGAADESGIAERVKPCAACHGEAGHSSPEAGAKTYYPSIAGKPAGYLHQQLLNFRDGRRHNAIMQPMLATLSDAYLREMADYYAAQPLSVSTQASSASAERLALGRQLVERGNAQRDIPACSACHGAGLKGAQPSIPGLRGLGADYLSAQLGAWRTGVRKAAAPDCMGQIAEHLSLDEIAAATAWIASLPPLPDARPANQPEAELPMRCGGVQ